MKIFTLKYLILLVVMCFFLRGLDASSPSPPPLDPCVIVIFGATGDLTASKLSSCLFTNLSNEGNLSKHTAVVGFARRDYTDTAFRRQMGEAIDQFAGAADSYLWKQFENKIFYHQSSFDQDEGYDNLRQRLSKIDLELGTQGNRLYYLAATQTRYFSTIIKKLSEHGLLTIQIVPMKNGPR